jgi:hypothetical protein
MAVIDVILKPGNPITPVRPLDSVISPRRLSGDELLFVRAIQTALEMDLEWSGEGVGKIDQHRLGNLLRTAKRRS